LNAHSLKKYFMPPLVSIIIISYNVSSIMRDCLLSIQAQTIVPYQIIIVDNASTDDSCQMVEREFPSVMLIKNAGNQGFARANNQGLAEATGRLTLFLNPDTIILDNAIDKLCAELDQMPHVGVLGPHTFNADGATTQATALHQPTLVRTFHAHIPVWRVVPFWKPAVLGEYIPRGSEAVDIVKGSCMLMRTDEARTIGGMNEAYFMYSEEIDLCEAVRKRGQAVFYTRRADIIHLGGASTSQMSAEMSVHLLRSLKKFFERTYSSSPLALQTLRVLLWTGSAWRLVAWKVLSAFGVKQEEAAVKARNHAAMLRWLWREYV
jgi:N-acetylglucosaminyl-diphospho-decaprenol L-rhamnosyltransferase